MVALKFDFDEAVSEVSDAIRSSPYGERLMRYFCREIGPRPTGSSAMRQAVEALAEEWQALGAVSVHSESVPVVAWNEADSQVQLDRTTYDSLQAIHSAAGTVEGPLLVVGGGDAEALRQLGGAVRGTVVLMRGHEISAGKYESTQRRVYVLQEAGAVGVILVSQQAALPAIEFMYPNKPVRIPVVSVSGKDGEHLAALASDSQVRARIQTGGRSRQATCLNLIGEIGPDRAPEEVIVLGAHLDCFYLSPGAFDNLTGVVALTEVARALAPFKQHFRRTLRIIAFTGEEYGFTGSKHYVRAHAAEMDRIRLVLTLDGLFDKTAEGIAVIWSPQVHEYLHRTLADLHVEVDVRDLFCMSSDYLPFMLQGVPACRQANWEGPYPMWLHTRQDTDDKVPVEWLRANAQVFAPLLLRVLTDPESLPFSRKTPSEVRMLLREEGAEDILLNWMDCAWIVE